MRSYWRCSDLEEGAGRGWSDLEEGAGRRRSDLEEGAGRVVANIAPLFFSSVSRRW